MRAVPSPETTASAKWRSRDALIVAGERLVPEALQGAEIVAMGQPLKLGPLVTGDKADSVGVGVNELAEQIQQTDVACKPPPSEARETSASCGHDHQPHGCASQGPSRNDPAVCDEFEPAANPDFIAVARVNGLLGAGRAITAQEVADELDVTLGALAVTEQQLARALNVSSYTSPRPLP